MRLTFSADDKVELFELDETAPIGTVEEIVCATLGVQSRVQWVLNGRFLQTSNKTVTLKMLELADGDLITLLPEARRPAPAVSAPTRNVRSRPNQPVYFPGMDPQEVLHYNPNPLMAVKVFRQNRQLCQQLSFHQPDLAASIADAPDDESAAEALREFLLFNSVNRSMQVIEEEQREDSMKKRLLENPSDEEAKKFMEDKANEELISRQREMMLAEYPETMFPVLMLYIETKINGVPVQAFVDSGAQTSVMTLACAKKCGIDKLIDKRYNGKIVGVGQSVALGKIYLVPIQIESTFFPMSVTIMESMGDTNMEFLFGLDMLKRHKFCIDLEKGILSFHGDNGMVSSTPFLHEKDLPQHKGGTQGFDPSKPQIELIEEEEPHPARLSQAAAPQASHEQQSIENASTPLAKSSNGQTVETSPASMDVQQPNARSFSGTDPEHDAKVGRLMAMGYSREDVERVLRNLEGDEETAATCLMFENGG